MKKTKLFIHENEALDPSLVEDLAMAISPIELPAHASTRIKDKIMARIASSEQIFVFADQGKWKYVAEGVQFKLLHRNDSSQSFLLHMDAKTELPHHTHPKDEESFVLDGEVWLDGVFCSKGDYHFAAAGTAHQSVRTATGCTLLIRSA